MTKSQKTFFLLVYEKKSEKFNSSLLQILKKISRNKEKNPKSFRYLFKNL